MEIKQLSASNIMDLRPQAGQNVLIIGGRAVIRQMQTLAASLALTRRVHILDGGNSLEPYLLAAEIRRLGKDPLVYLQHITATRAFSSVQFQSMAQKAADGFSVERDTVYFVLDMLPTFYDESLPLNESRRLLNLSIQCLQHIGHDAPLVIQVNALNQAKNNKAVIFEQLVKAFPNVLVEYEQPDPNPVQLGLF